VKRAPGVLSGATARALTASALLLFIACTTAPRMASAGSSDTPEQRIKWREIWAGADVSKNVWLLYSGATVAPFGDIHQDGVRLRAVAGYGQYTYTGYPRYETFHATTVFADVLAGYLVRWGPLTAKAFAGVSFIDHQIEPLDAENISISGQAGAKGVLEFWYNVSPKAWSSLDLAYTTAHDTASARMRSGYRVWPQVSVGVEAGLNLDGQAQCKMRLSTQKHCLLDDNDTHVKSLLDFGRTGVFARYEWDGGEISVSGGGMGQILDASGDLNLDPYVTANWILQF
jgi:Cellulose biosynthesis protein BcsS